MFEHAPVSTADLTAFIDHLSNIDPTLSDPERIDQIASMERAKSALAAAQARVSAAFAASQRAQLTALGVSRSDAGRSIGSQIALARRDSPTKGSRHLGFAEALVTEMPHTLAALAAGETSEWRATLMVRETAMLTVEDRTAVDAELAGRLGGFGDGRTAQEARRIGYRLDPSSALRRVRGAVADRRVTIRPAPDAMSRLSFLLPVAQGVAMYASLARHADTCPSEGETRTRSQIMADEGAHRILNPRAAATTASVGVEVQLVMTDTTLFGSDGGTAEIPGHGPIPGALARELFTAAAQAGAAWIRRLYTHPDTGHLVAMESRRRTFPTGLNRFIRTRDNVCRTPWCDAPIRHIDHITPNQHGGTTSHRNGQGLCERCNYTKQAPGWTARAKPDGTITTTTPTGHTYQSPEPKLPVSERPPDKGIADAA